MQCLYSLFDGLVDPHSRLVPPSVSDEVSADLHTKIAVCLATRFGKTMRIARKHVPHVLMQYGKVRRLGGGDMIHARELVPVREDTRDASFVRVRH